MKKGPNTSIQTCLNGGVRSNLSTCRSTIFWVTKGALAFLHDRHCPRKLWIPFVLCSTQSVYPEKLLPLLRSLVDTPFLHSRGGEVHLQSDALELVLEYSAKGHLSSCWSTPHLIISLLSENSSLVANHPFFSATDNCCKWLYSAGNDSFWAIMISWFIASLREHWGGLKIFFSPLFFGHFWPIL